LRVILVTYFGFKGNLGTLCPKFYHLRVFQRFRLVKFIEKFKTRVKNLKIEKIIAFDSRKKMVLVRQQN